MKRSALIIGAPCEKGAKGYLPGVEADIANYKEYLTSPLGGFWRKDEIITLRNPSGNQVRSSLDTLKSSDYSMTVFCGHGYHSSEDDSTFIQINSNDEMDGKELRTGAKRRVIIYDCCRELTYRTVVEAYERALKSEPPHLNAEECRYWYDQQIEKCPSAQFILNACAIDELSSEKSDRGGNYSSALLDSADKWWRASTKDTRTKYKIFTVSEAHRIASGIVSSESDYLQNPQIEMPRTEVNFPFAVIA
ncbi:hypothetical protein A6A40_21085 (plasmid) [Azospirillum humicireducens]|uniref:Peptidase C14 caspase domain-containing protein n=1 Tax=Azospirillum humicireducens TaxID=1226968 RepID=A0A2R4VSU0_9PROT|nr:caspase family protein [Azospirillum humicireducens]AWB07518.1 hypothetical protein A6A40_21085 [Azospirillum humicireducens]